MKIIILLMISCFAFQVSAAPRCVDVFANDIKILSSDIYQIRGGEDIYLRVQNFKNEEGVEYTELAILMPKHHVENYDAKMEFDISANVIRRADELIYTSLESLFMDIVSKTQLTDFAKKLFSEHVEKNLKSVSNPQQGIIGLALILPTRGFSLELKEFNKAIFKEYEVSEN